MKEKNIYRIIYLIMIICVIGIAIWSSIRYGHPSEVAQARNQLVAVSDEWRNDKGDAVDVEHLQKMTGVIPDKSFSIYHMLPEELGEGQSLCFRTKNVIVKVYVDEQCLYKSNVPSAALNSEAVGTNWNYVDLPSECAGKELELRVTTTYKSAKAKIDHVYIGSDRAYQLVTIYDKLFAIITCMLFIFVGIVLLFVDIAVNAANTKKHELRYLGIFSLVISLWCFMETYVIQMLTGDARTVHVLSCCLLMLIPIATVRFLSEAYGEKLKLITRIVVILSTLEFVVNLVLQLVGAADFQTTLMLSHVLLILSAIILFITVMKHTISEKKKDSNMFFKMVRGLGLGCIGITTAIDVVRFYIGSGDDVSRFVRLGILIFIVCYAGSSLEKSMDAIKLGAKAEIISQLAYQDGLTNLGNRTLFNERIEALNYQKMKDRLEVAIVMFDVNNLKLVNDQLGHQMGDDMLRKSADLIQKVYSQEGECFRIGGDEFVAIIKGSMVKTRCEACERRFEEVVAAYNDKKEKNFRIQIAIGYCVYEPTMGNKELTDIYELADSRMYMKKKQMKAVDQEEVIIINSETSKLMSEMAKSDTRKLREERERRVNG